MPQQSVEVKLEAQAFARFSINNVAVELFVVSIAGGAAVVQIKSPKKIRELRVYKELEGFNQPRPKIATPPEDPARRKTG